MLRVPTVTETAEAPAEIARITAHALRGLDGDEQSNN